MMCLPRCCCGVGGGVEGWGVTHDDIPATVLLCGGGRCRGVGGTTHDDVPAAVLLLPQAAVAAAACGSPCGVEGGWGRGARAGGWGRGARMGGWRATHDDVPAAVLLCGGGRCRRGGGDSR